MQWSRISEMSNENCDRLKYLETSLEIDVRFSETDAMGVIWHGNYLKYFEDAREYFGLEYGMVYLDLYHKGYFTPIVKSQIDHKNSVNYGQKIKVIARLEKKDSAKIVFHYEVINLATNKLAAKGSTVQVFLGVESNSLELIKPSFISEWEEKQNWIEA